MFYFKYLLIIFLLIISGCSNNMTDEEHLHDESQSNNDVRRPAVAGQFYPANAEDLKSKIDQFLEFASEEHENIYPKAIIVPHAGYDYSGIVAASAFKQLKGKEYNTVVIVCNSHSDYFNGIAVSESEAWATPLGQVEIDFELAESLVRSNEKIQFNSEVHTSDHTLEVQLPFLQTVLNDGFKIVPIVFGNAENETYRYLFDALNKNLRENDLLVISTDLSHYPSSAVAREIDEKTLDLIKAGSIEKLEEHIKKTMERRLPNEQTLCCGIDGVKTLMALAQDRNWDKVEILKYMNSGEIDGGDKMRVVGYGSMVFATSGEPIKNESHFAKATQDKKLKIKNYRLLQDVQKERLLGIVRETIEEYVKNGSGSGV
jgi:AmmeMemoRadiSam system protein B